MKPAIDDETSRVLSTIQGRSGVVLGASGSSICQLRFSCGETALNIFYHSDLYTKLLSVPEYPFRPPDLGLSPARHGRSQRAELVQLECPRQTPTDVLKLTVSQCSVWRKFWSIYSVVRYFYAIEFPCKTSRSNRR